MQPLTQQILIISQNFDTALAQTTTLKMLEDVRVHFLGKKGIITELMAQLKTLSLDEKKVVGPLLIKLRSDAEQKIQERKEQIIIQVSQAANFKKENFDITALRGASQQGHLHPFTRFIEEIEDIFISMGYEILDGPELETDFYNFTGLNIPADHPARDMYDTFWVDLPGRLLRTHTSPVQVRSMESKSLPIAAVVPGRTYRHEAVDASHDFMFMQCEGFFIDKKVSLAHLFGTAQTFLKALFKKDELDIRIRPGFFPFVEPGVEIDMRCQFCSGGCSVCKKSTWVEVFPGGMIHPNVLRAGGIDPDIYSGFAFGFGLTRLAMLKYGIDDIRHLYGGKLKFLEQF
jgi:phenylalanyl-tRNA synthetase alpha chain